MVSLSLPVTVVLRPSRSRSRRQTRSASPAERVREMDKSKPGSAKDPSWNWKRSSEFEQKQLEMLHVPQPRMTWEEYKEKHKDQLNERMGMGDKEQASYRRMLDEERKRRVCGVFCP